MTSGPAYVERLLRAWAAPGGGWPTPEVAQRYADAMALPFVAHSAAEYYRWVVRSQVRPDGRRFVRRVQAPGAGAGAATSRASATARWRPRARAARRPTSPARTRSTSSPGRGTSCPRRRPGAVNAHLTRWLDGSAEHPRLERGARRSAAGVAQPAAQPPVPTGGGRVPGLRQHRRRLVQRQRVAGAVVVQRLGEDDADDLAGRGQQRAAGVAGLDPGVEGVDLAHGAGLAVDVGAAGVEDRRGRGRRPAGTGPSSGKPATTAAVAAGEVAGPAAAAAAGRPGTASTARSRLGSKTTTRAVVRPPGAADADLRRRHAGHDVGVGDDAARGERPSRCPPGRGCRPPRRPVTLTTDGRPRPRTPRGGRRPRVGRADRRDRLGAEALEDPREALAVEHGAEAGEQLRRSAAGHHPVDRLQRCATADGPGQRRGGPAAHRAGDEPHQDADRDQRGDRRPGRRRRTRAGLQP